MPGAMTSAMPTHASAFGRSPQTTKPLSVANSSAVYRNGAVSDRSPRRVLTTIR